MSKDKAETTARDQLQEQFTQFERDHPEVVEALRIMNVSFRDYLQALALLRGLPSTSGNATTLA